MVYAFSLKRDVGIKDNADRGHMGNLAGSQLYLKKLSHYLEVHKVIQLISDEKGVRRKFFQALVSLLTLQRKNTFSDAPE